MPGSVCHLLREMSAPSPVHGGTRGPALPRLYQQLEGWLVCRLPEFWGVRATLRALEKREFLTKRNYGTIDTPAFFTGCHLSPWEYELLEGHFVHDNIPSAQHHAGAAPSLFVEGRKERKGRRVDRWMVGWMCRRMEGWGEGEKEGRERGGDAVGDLTGDSLAGIQLRPTVTVKEGRGAG